MIVTLIAVVISVVGILLLRGLSPASTSSPAPTPQQQSIDTSGWQTYRNDEYDFEMRYPNIMELQERENGFTLSHSVKFAHGNPCDFIGDGSTLTELFDFSVNAEVFSANLINVVKAWEGSYLADNFVKGDTLLEERGFIDAVVIGELSGYRISSGVEGCGVRTYYLSLSGNKTLRLQIPLELGARYNTSTLQEAGAFSSEESEDLYTQILSTFRFTTGIRLKVSCVDKIYEKPCGIGGAIVKTPDGREVVRIVANGDSNPQMSLDPGDYMVVPLAGPVQYPVVDLEPRQVTVKKGEFTEFIVSYWDGRR